MRAHRDFSRSSHRPQMDGVERCHSKLPATSLRVTPLKLTIWHVVAEQ